MDGDGGGDGVVFSVDDGDGTLAAGGAGVDHVNLVARGAGGDGDGILADGQFAVEAHIDHVEDGDGAAAAVGDVGIFAVVGRVLREVVRAAGGEGQKARAMRLASRSEARLGHLAIEWHVPAMVQSGTGFMDCCAVMARPRGVDVDAAGEIAADHGGDLLDLVHHGGELVGIDGLRAVGERLFGLVVDFDQDAVGAGGDGGAGHGQHAVAAAGAVAGVDEDGQVAEALDGGNDAEVEGVAGVVGKGAHAALAEDDLVVALAHDVLGGHEELFEGGGEAALEQDGLAQAAGVLEQGEVLHVAGADLDDVGPFGDQVEGFVVDGFGDDAQAEAVADLGHDAQRFEAQALKGVGRGAGLVGAAAEELRAGGGDLLGDGEGLFAAFDGAGAGDDGQVAAADGGVGSGESG